MPLAFEGARRKRFACSIEEMVLLAETMSKLDLIEEGGEREENNGRGGEPVSQAPVLYYTLFSPLAS